MIKKIDFDPMRQEGDIDVIDGVVTMKDGSTREFAISGPAGQKSEWEFQKMIFDRIKATIQMECDHDRSATGH